MNAKLGGKAMGGVFLGQAVFRGIHLYWLPLKWEKTFPMGSEFFF
jgi:hypothetical protein